MYKLTDNLDLDSVGIPLLTLNNTAGTGTGIYLKDAVSVVAVCFMGTAHDSAVLAWHVEQGIDLASWADLATYTAAHLGTADNTIVLIEIPAFALSATYNCVRVVCTETATQNASVIQTWVKNAKSKPA
jgi:hypothetical protein